LLLVGLVAALFTPGGKYVAEAAESVDGVNRGPCTAVLRALNEEDSVDASLGAAGGADEGAGGTAGAGRGDRDLSAGTFQPLNQKRQHRAILKQHHRSTTLLEAGSARG
jgi:hypothetical protein